MSEKLILKSYVFLSFTNRSYEIAYRISHRYFMVEPNLKGSFSDNIHKRERIYPFLSMGGRRAELKLNVKIFICLGEEFDIHMVV